MGTLELCKMPLWETLHFYLFWVPCVLDNSPLQTWGAGLCVHTWMGVKKLNPYELDLVAVPTGTDLGGKGKGLGESSP